MRNILTYSLLLLVMLYSSSGYSQENKTISGTITAGTSKEPIVGATIAVGSGTAATQTDSQGVFTLQAKSTDVLRISSLGFISQQLLVGDKTTFELFLVEEASMLEEAVVIGYGTQRKVDLTGSISSVKGEAIANMPNTNPISSLQGKVPGLTISNSGSPGASPTVRIRGVNSTNNANPLYVVDGVLHDNIDFISAQDIENIDVLKDPSSIAIYGLRGANGVIAVTLKKAARGKTAVNFTGSAGFNKVHDRIDVVDSAGFKKLYNAQLANLGAPPFDYSNYTANTNWQDLILRTAFNSNNNISISNSTEKNSTHLSLGHSKQQGVVRNGDYERFTARLSQEVMLSQRIKVGGELAGSYWKMAPTSVSLTNALWAAPIVPVQYDANTYYSMPSFQRAQVGNVMATLNRSEGTALPRGYRAVGSLFAEIEILQNLKWKSIVYADLGFNNSRSYSALPFSYMNLGENGQQTTITLDNNQKTSVTQAAEEFRRFQQDHTLTYESTFADKHRVTGLLGFTTVYNDNTSLSGTRRDTTNNVPNDPNLWYWNIINQTSNPAGSYSGSGSNNTLAGAFARANYAYANKYLINATIRRDGSSKFAPGNRWGTFGSIGLGWVLTEESFLQQVEKLNFMKLRFAWGKIGNSNGIRDNIYLPGLSNASTAIFGDNIYTAVQAEYIPDPNLKWEVVRGIDLGLEIKAFANKFNAEVNLYDRTTSDILTAVPLPNDTRSYFTNLGEITNRGIEVSTGWNNSIADFRYGLQLNYSYNENKVNSIGEGINFQILGNNGANVTETGQSIGYFYGYQQAGIYQTVHDVQTNPSLNNSLPGDIQFADINGDGVITTDDRTYLGTPFPPHSYGLNLSLGYKNLDFLIEGHGVAGNTIYAIRRTSNFAVLNYESNRLDAWTGPGTSNVEPIIDNSRGNNYLFSNYFLEPGDFFRIRSLQLGYSLNKSLLANSVVRGLRLFANIQNLKTWSKTTGYSPEAAISSITAGGLDNGNYPLPATYTLGINLSF